ncbi:MAG: NADH-quinone oxidoreductase subunit M [Thermoprotei archaeon]|nr:MAG: NADH-quinone oxidoreductase subunit M [Thermoprotei archaeon]
MVIMVLVLLSILIQLASAPLALLARDWRRSGVIATFAVALGGLVLTTASVRVLRGEVLEEFYPIAPALNLLKFRVDGFNLAFALLISLLSVVVALYSMEYMRGSSSPGAYYSLYLVYAAAMMGSVISSSLTTFFIFFELMLIPSWALIAYWGTGRREVIALKYFLFTEVGALLTMAGMALTYASFGTLDFTELRSRLAAVPPEELMLPALLLSIGPLVKMAVVPVHAWLPDAHAEAPTPISALLSPAMIGIGGWALTRILLYSMPQLLASAEARTLLMFIAVLTMGYGSLCAFAQDDVKRLLAYSSISQMGYMLLGIASACEAGVVGAATLYFSHGLAKAALFMVSGILYHELRTRSISRMGGLAPYMKITATTAIISFLSLAGVPPLLGFWAELQIFLGAIAASLGFEGALGYSLHAGSMNYGMLALAITAVLLAVLTAGYGLWTIKRVFYGELPEEFTHVEEKACIMTLMPLLLAMLSVGIGIYPSWLIDLARLAG